MQMTKKVVSVVLAVLMIMSMMVVGTVVASAAGDVAQVNGTNYASLEAALAAAPSGATVTLLDDIDYSTTYTVRNARDNGQGHSINLKDCTLDLNGHTISSINGTVTFAGDGATIKNGTFDLIPKNTDGSYKDGSYALIIDNVVAGYPTTATVDLKNVTCNGAVNFCGVTSTLENVTARTTPTKFYTIWAEQGAKVTVKSGTFTDAQSGGKGVLATGTGDEGGASISVEGGNFNASNKVVYNAETNSIEIAGGIFSKEVPDTYLAAGLTTIDDGGKKVVVETGTDPGSVAVIGSKGYTTLQAALNAAQNGDTVTLIADINESTAKYSTTNRTYGIAGKSDFTLDGNGHTVTISNSSAVRGFGVWYEATGEGADITFKNITINNALSAGRAIDTRGNNIKSLTLDNVVLNCTAGGYSQALTIGGNPSPIMDLNIINNSEIHDSKYYAITTFNPVNATITNSTIEGWACIYAKGADGSTGSTGSVYNITNSTLISQNNYSSAGGYNNFAMVMLEDSNVEVNISDCNITVKGGGDLQGIFMQNSLSKTNNEVNLGAGNNVTLTGDTAVFAENLGNNSTLEVTGGTFNTIIPIEYIADDNICVNAAEAGKFTIGADTNPLNSLEAVGPVTSDGNQFGIVNDYLAGSLIGVQRKDKPSVDAPETSESNQEDTNDMRFVAVIDTMLLKNAEDYGFVLAKVPSTKTTVNFDNLKAYWGNGEKTVSAKDTKNNVCGDEKYGDPDDSSTAYKYVTCAVNSVEDGYKIVARFFVKKDGKTYYGKYAKGGNYSDNVTGALVGMSDLVTA